MTGGLKVRRKTASSRPKAAQPRNEPPQAESRQADAPKARQERRKAPKPKPAPPAKKKPASGKPHDEIMAFIDRSVKSKPRSEQARAGRPTQQDEEHTPSTFRLFFALRVPTEVANRLAETQRKLRGNWRAVNPGQMHITLTYLPAVPPDKREDLKRLGTRLMQDLPPMTVKLRGTGYFPNEGSPRVWFVKVEAEGLTELAEQLRQGVQELGVQTDDLPFKAHITLARKKGPAPRIPPLILDHLEWTATSGTLYRSILRKTGPIYEPQSTFRFRGTAPPPDGNTERPQATGHEPQAPQE